MRWSIEMATRVEQAPRFRVTGKLLISGVLLLWLVVTVYPIIFLFFTSLKTDPQILSTPCAIPFPPQVQNYAAVMEGGRTNQSILVYFANSVIVTVGTLALLLVCSSLA